MRTVVLQGFALMVRPCHDVNCNPLPPLTGCIKVKYALTNKHLYTKCLAVQNIYRGEHDAFQCNSYLCVQNTTTFSDGFTDRLATFQKNTVLSHRYEINVRLYTACSLGWREIENFLFVASGDTTSHSLPNESEFLISLHGLISHTPYTL